MSINQLVTALTNAERKQAKIEEQLTALGYNVDGTKMDF